MVALGSNLGDRLANLREAIAKIGSFAEVLALSPIYETPPVGGPVQGAYLNAAARVRFVGTPEALLDALLDVERALGRVRRERWGPRTIDLDVLHIDGVTLTSERLTIPHPRLLERDFALAPLHDVLPNAPYPKPRAAPGPAIADATWSRDPRGGISGG